MPERVLTAAELSRASLARQLLLEPASLDPVTAVEQLVALQAQEPASPYLALWTRLAGFKAADLHQAFHDRTVVKGTLLRVTLHVVSARDYRLYWPALAPRLRHWREPMLRQVGLGPEIEALAGQAAAFAAEPRFGTELRDHLPALTGDPGPAGQTDSWWAIRPFLPFLMAPGEPPWSFGRRPRFVAAQSWLGTELADPGAGLRHLIERYLAGFGPAGIDDIHKFSHIPAPVLRAVMEAPGAGLLTFRDSKGRRLYDVPDAPLPPGDTPAPVRFLPMWDSLLLAYADRDRVMPAAQRPMVIRKNGDFLPTFTVDGLVAGLWRADRVDGRSQVTPLPFAPLKPDVQDAVMAEAARLERFIEPLEPAVYSRYATTWLKDQPARGSIDGNVTHDGQSG
ncbi:MAG TPA: winged helix DNA-binding domain-containing protein [Candidatus Limnocylindrales bacterium]|nr:winged helix DNA-binding domain-containing protein [Candidatus Limnocylindrales bacterium]